jgi:hypothetical protein
MALLQGKIRSTKYLNRTMLDQRDLTLFIIEQIVIIRYYLQETQNNRRSSSYVIGGQLEIV